MNGKGSRHELQSIINRSESTTDGLRERSWDRESHKNPELSLDGKMQC